MPFDDDDEMYVTLAPARRARVEDEPIVAAGEPEPELTLVHPGEVDPEVLQGDVDWLVTPYATEGFRGWLHHHTGLRVKPDRRERRSRERFLHLYRQAHDKDQD